MGDHFHSAVEVGGQIVKMFDSIVHEFGADNPLAAIMTALGADQTTCRRRRWRINAAGMLERCTTQPPNSMKRRNR